MPVLTLGCKPMVVWRCINYSKGVRILSKLFSQGA